MCPGSQALGRIEGRGYRAVIQLEGVAPGYTSHSNKILDIILPVHTTEHLIFLGGGGDAPRFCVILKQSDWSEN